MSHPNRSKRNPGPDANPSPAQVRSWRERAGLTQSDAARLIYGSKRAWANWESEEPSIARKMHPGLFELFKIKAFYPELFKTFLADLERDHL